MIALINFYTAFAIWLLLSKFVDYSIFFYRDKMAFWIECRVLVIRCFRRFEPSNNGPHAICQLLLGMVQYIDDAVIVGHDRSLNRKKKVFHFIRQKFCQCLIDKKLIISLIIKQ